MNPLRILNKQTKIAYSPTPIYEWADIIGINPIIIPARSAVLCDFGISDTMLISKDVIKTEIGVENIPDRCGIKKWISE